MEKYDVLILDVYNIFYKWSYFENNSDFITIDGVKLKVNGIIQYLNALNTYINKYAKNDAKIYLCFDNANTLIERHNISDKYKQSRKKRQPDNWFYKSLDYCELISKYYRDDMFVIRCPNYEADDYVSNILEYYTAIDDKVLMISEDEDWCRYLSKNVNQYMKHEIWDSDKFIIERGFEPTPTNIGFWKSFYGDVSDDIIPALSNYPNIYFKEVIENYSEMKDFIDDVKKGNLNYLDLGWKTKVENNELDLLTNFILVKGAEIPNSELQSYISKTKYQENKLRIIYSMLGILGKVDERIKPIEKNISIFDMLDGESLERL